MKIEIIQKTKLVLYLLLNFYGEDSYQVEEFDKIGSCLDAPDTFDSWMLYSSSDQDYSPEF